MEVVLYLATQCRAKGGCFRMRNDDDAIYCGNPERQGEMDFCPYLGKIRQFTDVEEVEGFKHCKMRFETECRYQPVKKDGKTKSAAWPFGDKPGRN